MSSIKTVAVAGASGNVGQPIVEALVAAGFTVTALTRESSTATFPAGVRVKKVDYASADSLRSALEGQDAVVSAVTTAAVGAQTPIVDAAFAAGVRRFIPSEFGLNTQTVRHPGLRTILAGKIRTLDYIREKSKEQSSFTWTGLSTGLFFDWGLKVYGLGFDKASRTADIIDSGDEPFSPSNFPFIGRAVAAVLARPDKTANRYLSVASFTTTRNRLRTTLEELTGEKWTANPVASAELDRVGNEKLAKGDFSAFSDFLRALMFGDGGGSALGGAAESANALLGLRDEDPAEALRAWLEDRL